MKHALRLSFIVLAVALLFAGFAGAQDKGPKILLLTRSAGFEHSVISHDKSGTSHVERILQPIVEELKGTMDCTKDAGKINAQTLEQYDVVIFYTSGNLTESGGDDQGVMAESGVEELIAWIKGGGGFLGFHSATDTFRSDDPEPTPYIGMIGAEFTTHGQQFVGTVKKVDNTHPSITSLPSAWSLQDEWYLFHKFDKTNMHVLALLEIGGERSKQDKYNIPDYPMIWCRGMDKGRILYNGMGHREDVWEHASFKLMLKEHLLWVSGQGALNAEPNYDAVVPKALP